MDVRCSVILAALLAGCTAANGPAQPPQPELPAQWRGPAIADAAQVDAQWWQAFGSAELSAWVTQAQASGLDVQAAAARVLQAEAAARASGATLWPTLDGAVASTHEGRLGGNASVDDNDYFVGLEASYDPDLWGRNRALRDGALARLNARRFDRNDVQLTLTSSVADQWLLRVSLGQRLAIARLNLSNAERVLDTVSSRQRAGSVTPLDLAQQRGVVAEQRKQVASLQQQASEAEIRLALLLGVPVQQVSVRTESLDSLAWPQANAGLPAELVLRRPDVARAESELAAAQADVKAARAALLPNITLGLQVGGSAEHWSRVFDSPIYALTGNLVAPIFNGGNLRAQRDEAQGREEELLVEYRRALITALTDVESGLNAAGGIEGQLSAQDEQLAQAKEAFRLAESRYRAGAETLLVLLDAQRSLYTAQDEWVQLRLQRLQASVALFKALGGGWRRTTG